MTILKYFPPKQNKLKNEANLIIPYAYQMALKPGDIQTPDKLYTVVRLKEYRIPIITYHYVENVKDPKDTIRKSLNIPPFVLDKELEELSKNNYQTLFMRDIPKIVSGDMAYSTKSAALTFDDGYEDFYTDAFPLLKKYNIKATIFIIYDFIGRKGFMTESELKEISDSKLVEIGAHTMDHLYLKLLQNNIVTKQVVGSKKGLEDMLQLRVESFAYPYGAFDQDTIDVVRAAGFTSAVSEIAGDLQSSENLLYLSRIRAGNFSYSNIIRFLESYNK